MRAPDANAPGGRQLLAKFRPAPSLRNLGRQGRVDEDLQQGGRPGGDGDRGRLVNRFGDQAG